MLSKVPLVQAVRFQRAIASDHLRSFLLRQSERRVRVVLSTVILAMARWACLIFLLLGYTAAFAEDWPYVRVSCNEELRQLLVEESSTDRRETIPGEKGVQDLTALTELRTMKSPTGDQDRRVRKSDFVLTCVLGKSNYRIQISPWKFNSKVNAMCGSYAPSTQLTVWRRGEILVEKLVFSGFCNVPESEIVIRAVALYDRTHQAEFSIVNRGHSIQKRLPYSQLKRFKRQGLNG